MKTFIYSVILALIIVGGGIIYTSHLDKVSKILIAKNEEIMNYIQNDEYTQAADCINNLSSYIDKKKIVLAATLDHGDLDNIEVTLAQMLNYTEQSNKADALAFNKTLDSYLHHLPKNYKVKIENIL